MKVHGSGITSAGPSYEKNEDAYYISNEHKLYVLCDGGADQALDGGPRRWELKHSQIP